MAASAAGTPLGRLVALGIVVCAWLLVSAARGAEADLEAGERLYRLGLRASGEPLAATVAADVPLLGTQVSCQGCHGRSGMGAAEGNYIVPPIAGPLLFAASPQPQRPAYEAQTLAHALREGVTPGGRSLSALMPRYRLTDDEAADLAAYLATLSVEPSPGVDDKTIRFATVVTEAVSASQRDDVLAVLRTYVAEKNRQTRLESQRRPHGQTLDSRAPSTFREWSLDVWTLSGPSDTWEQQLESYYRRAPVFAMLGGLATGSWAPISQFCERRAIPCLFPSTDLPAAAPTDFYTLYFSRGIELEASLVARHLAATPVRSVTQVYCAADAAAAARALRAELAPTVTVQDLEFACTEPLPVSALASHLDATTNAAVVLWVRREQLLELERPLPAGRVYVSGMLLERDLGNSALLEAPGPVLAAYAFRSPSEPDPALARFLAWARVRGIPVRDTRRQAEAFFACLAANDAVSHLHRFFIRDFMLDMLDHAQGLTAYVPLYPRPTVGPGQRYLNKGGYVLPIAADGKGSGGLTWIAP